MLFFAFMFGLFAIIKSDCPNGTISSFTDPTSCYSFQPQNNYFMDAEGICKNLGGNLVIVKDMFENIFISEQALVHFTESTNTDFWFGATFLLSDTWTGIDGSKLSFTDWDKGQPQNSSNTGCGAITMQGGKWISDDCFKQKPFVCLIKISPVTTVAAPTTTMKSKNCPDRWTYYDFTGFCYKVFYNETWLDSETRCLVDKAHLTSIHSLEEDLFLANLASDTSDSTYGWQGQTWIGLFTDDDNLEWQWSDGTDVDYLQWAPGEPNLPGTENCAQVWSGSLVGEVKFGEFNNFPCDITVYNFICKKLPK